MAVLAFYNNADCDGLAANIKSQCKTHGLTSFTEVWPTACRCVQRLAVCCETGGFCIIAEISTVCKNFYSDSPDAAGGYGIRPYGVGGDARHQPGSVVTAAMCRGRTMFAPTAPLLNCIVGRGLDPSAGRCKHRPLQKRPAGIFSPAGRFSLVILVIIDQAAVRQDPALGVGHRAELDGELHQTAVRLDGHGVQLVRGLQ